VKNASVLLVDDDDTLRKVLARELGEGGLRVRAFASAVGVVEALREEPADVVLLDLRLPGEGGLDLLRRIRAEDEAAQVVVITGHGAVAEAVQAMKLGAHDFLTKPVRLEVLEQVLHRAAEKRALLDDVARLRRALEPGGGGTALLGTSPAIVRLREEIARVAVSDASVLVLGENGTGKELVAREVHTRSRRAQRPFVVVNCGAIPAGLVESELFGHEKGAFTGAERRRIGLFEAAHGGTLFLDEVGDLPKSIQPSLLRALQSGELRPVGSERARQVDVRVVAATNRDLRAMLKSGEFREDLYYRLATLVLEVPPLRARRQDVAVLARFFVGRSAAHHGRELELDESALSRLADHEWPGNVRELENAAERLCVMSDGRTIGAELVERHVLGGPAGRGELPTVHLDDLEKLAIATALRHRGGDKRAAAADLGIALKTLYRKIELYGLRAGAEAEEPS